mgnify:FL=1|tara:strand:+ start:172 stop:804 length:633 start_codon:yes stop_codon:yes gene_type:complete
MSLSAEQSELRALSYPLYLCTSFAPLSNQPVLQDLLSLSCQLTEAVIQPSEQMLKAIRVQWWVECIRDLQLQNSPLLDRIIHHIESGVINKEKLLFILEGFQDATFEENPKKHLKRCWGLIFEYYFAITGTNLDGSLSVIGSVLSEILYFPIDKFNNSIIEDELNVIHSIKSKDGFIKSCTHLAYLSRDNKLINQTLLPMRLFWHVLTVK